ILQIDDFKVDLRNRQAYLLIGITNAFDEVFITSNNFTFTFKYSIFIRTINNITIKKLTRIIADSGSTKTTWALLKGERKIITKTQGISPYFLSKKEIETVIREELMSPIRTHVKETEVEEI